MPVAIKRDEAFDLIIQSLVVRVILTREGDFLFTQRESLMRFDEPFSFDIFVTGYWFDVGHPLRITMKAGEQVWVECDMERVKQWIKDRESASR